jgi:hypothetical protein
MKNIDKWIKISTIGFIICNILLVSFSGYIKQITANRNLTHEDVIIISCLQGGIGLPFLFISGLILLFFPWRIIDVGNRQFNTKIALKNGYYFIVLGIVLLLCAFSVIASFSTNKCIDHILFFVQ